jgi:hypothetical protein
MGVVGLGRLDHVILVQWVRGAGRFFERKDLLWHGEFHLIPCIPIPPELSCTIFVHMEELWR